MRRVSWIFLLSLFLAENCLAFLAADSLVMHFDAASLADSYVNGNKVSLWKDSSGHGNNALQDMASAQPVYIGSDPAFDDLPVVRFDGDSDWLKLSSTAINVSSYTMFAVARHARIDQEQYIIAGQNGTGNNRARMGIDHERKFVWRAGSSDVVTSDADTRVHIFAATSELEAYLDGRPVASNANSSREYPASFNLGSYNRGEKAFFLGDLAEVIIFNRILTGQELNEIGSYLEAKYGLDTIYRQKDKHVIGVSPSDQCFNVALDKVLSWQAPVAVANPAYNVYFGTSKDKLDLVAEMQSQTVLDPMGQALLKPGQRYYWRVDIEGIADKGTVYSFVTRQSESEQAVGPLPPDMTNLTGNKDSVGGTSFVSNKPVDNSFAIVADGQVCNIYVDENDYEVCRLAADLLAGDIESVCGIRPQVVNDIKLAQSDNVIIIGTYKRSKVVDQLVKNARISVTDIAGQWETFALETVNSPVEKVKQALVIYGSDRRGTAYGVVDLSEKIGVSPWYWFADVPVKYQSELYVRSGRYKQGPPSVKYRGFFINDEDWGLHPWARYTYSPEEGNIGPEAHKRIFEMMLRIKANYLWPGMHRCTKAFHAFAENKVVADQYAIVMGSSHCEQMSRDNEWEWYRWSPKDGSDRGAWDWCTNSNTLIEYWRDAVAANGQYENVYTTGMRGIHDSGMPCSGATNAQKVLAMQNEVFPAQRKMISELVNPDPSKVPQIFCPYKEVLGLYDLGMDVPDDITLVWPDDNYGYIRRLSNTKEQARSGSAGVYYHFSYLGPPEDYLWLYSTPLGLIWEEMVKAYQYGADRVWVFNAGDIKPAELGLDYAMRLAWNIDNFSHENIREYLELWAWQQFGAEQRKEIADILIEYFRLAQNRKPEHMSSGGFTFSMTEYGDEAQKRLQQYASITDRANGVYDKLPETCRDAFYQLVLYQVRCADLMNQKIINAHRNIYYASQGRVSANDYAQLAHKAYEQIIAETDHYNNVMSDGKWKYVMSWQPRHIAPYYRPATIAVAPESPAVMGVILEGQSKALTDTPVVGISYSDNFADRSTDNWQPNNPDRWTVRSNGGMNEFAIHNGDYNNLSGGRLGEIALLRDMKYDYFNFKTKVRLCDRMEGNSSADAAVVFGYLNEMNYYYFILSSKDVTKNSYGSDTVLFRVVNGVRAHVRSFSLAVRDNDYHDLELVNDKDGLTIIVDGSPLEHIVQRFPAGQIGIGSYNDTAAFTDIKIEPIIADDVLDALPVFDVYTKSSHFIDIYNKGKGAFDWSATASEPWVKLDIASGMVETQQRLWVSLDWPVVPTGASASVITIAGPDGDVSVRINAFKPAFPEPDQLDCVVESKGYVSLEAENYTRKTDRNGAAWQVIDSFGSTGDTLTVLPFDTASCNDVTKLLSQSPSVEYDMYLWSSGTKDITIRAIPTHPINSEMKLRYAIAFDDQQPVIVDYSTREWSPKWYLNVLQGVTLSTANLKIEQAGKHTLKIWMVDPGVVLDKIIIGKAPVSHLGPPQTNIIR
ncbi:MAG: glycosyl hydrolase 115 family protein [Sedimentisphaerales bacterium]|nr:glycosyl hydrolase 115 family protein [Sedimentisphaerales bacterium]